VASALAIAAVADAGYGGAAPAAPFTLASLEPTSGGTYIVRAWVDSDGDGRLDAGECFGESTGLLLAPAPGAGADAGLITIDSLL
jgi:hypothetical protein